MSLFFLFNNLHFTVEILGALAFLIAGWLSFDAYILHKNKVALSRFLGFWFLAAYQLLHAFDFGPAFTAYAVYPVYFLGIFLVLMSFIWESPEDRPEFKAVVILPVLGSFFPVLGAAAALGFAAIVLISFRQYKKENKKILLPFIAGFAFLAAGSLLSLFYKADEFTFLWALGHILEFFGFLALGWWVWQYLLLRVRESMLIIFTAMALLISTAVTLAFSTILVSRLEMEAENSLSTDVRVLDLAVSGLKEESLAKIKLLAKNPEIGRAIEENDFSGLEAVLGQALESEKLGFLLAADKDGYVILRAHAPSAREDNLSGEKAAAAAMSGLDLVTVESSPAEGFSIRAASPIWSSKASSEKSGSSKQKKLAGVLIGGFPLDNALADRIKKITGLEMSIFSGDTRTATTELNPDLRTRSIGIRLADKEVAETVLKNGLGITLRTQILSRPYLASFLPLFDADGHTVGMLGAAQPQEEILALSTAINRLTLITVIVIMFILAAPVYFITKRLASGV